MATKDKLSAKEHMQLLKLHLVEQALQSNFTRKQLHDISLSQFVNRLLLLFQRPRIFIFYRKEGKKWCYVKDTYGDTLFKSLFYVTVIQKLHILDRGKRFYRVPDESWRSAPLPIGTTGFGLVIVSAERYNPENHLSFKPVDKEEYGLLEDLWKTFLESGYSEVLGVEARLRRLLENLCGDNEAGYRIMPVADETDLEVPPGLERKLIDEQLECLTGIVESLYVSLRGTPSICARGKKPPNLFFFLRYYDHPETVNRFKDGIHGNSNDPYPYSLRIVVPKTQSEDFKDTFQNISKSSKPPKQVGGEWTYRPERIDGFKSIFARIGESENHFGFPDIRLDEQFWKDIRGGEKNKFREILNCIKQPFSQNARSMVDPVLMSGCTHYRPGVFTLAGAERVTEQVREEGSESIDSRRLVYMHYLLSAAAPTNDTEPVGLMSVPLSVGGHPYMVVSHAMVSASSKASARDRVDIEKTVWPRNFHFFTDVGRHCVRRLRYRTKTEYLSQIGAQVLQGFEYVLSEAEGKLEVINGNHVVSYINKRLKTITRVWPYRMVQIEMYPWECGMRQGKRKLRVLEFVKGKAVALGFDILENQFFRGGADLAEGEMASYIQDKEVFYILESTMNRVKTMIELPSE